jgi:hypothetical protein
MLTNSKNKQTKGKTMKQLNRMLLTATLLIGAIFGMILTPPVTAAITFLLNN